MSFCRDFTKETPENYLSHDPVAAATLQLCKTRVLFVCLLICLIVYLFVCLFTLSFVYFCCLFVHLFVDLFIILISPHTFFGRLSFCFG